MRRREIERAGRSRQRPLVPSRASARELLGPLGERAGAPGRRHRAQRASALWEWRDPNNCEPCPVQSNQVFPIRRGPSDARCGADEIRELLASANSFHPESGGSPGPATRRLPRFKLWSDEGVEGGCLHLLSAWMPCMTAGAGSASRGDLKRCGDKTTPRAEPASICKGRRS